jgi:hypothetical protein
MIGEHISKVAFLISIALWCGAAFLFEVSKGSFAIVAFLATLAGLISLKASFLEGRKSYDKNK